ncbi:Metallo-dependent phosphatase-like protein [Mycena indigotica]|uniref:Metallo-dependent phosphatase-like protein n=1 Tax=Mycena indigotica TaxID=2126181 RepID=A0A8H6W1V7_9AGAR|nr:Metallo-dependent phosphatase-like protein [Mycena indigotica]KAF7298608.1 Metallo-dependent phosphatase-like protein [Mycena indigotica]
MHCSAAGPSPSSAHSSNGAHRRQVGVQADNGHTAARVTTWDTSTGRPRSFFRMAVRAHRGGATNTARENLLSSFCARSWRNRVATKPQAPCTHPGLSTIRSTMLLCFPALALAAAAVAGPTIRDAKATLKGVISSQRKLVFDKTGSFKVVSFSDMHFGERAGDGSWAAWGPEHDAATQKVHAAVLDKEKPDYVVFNGDIMTGENVLAANATSYLDLAYAPTVARKIPFSATHGNHDNAVCSQTLYTFYARYRNSYPSRTTSTTRSRSSTSKPNIPSCRTPAPTSAPSLMGAETIARVPVYPKQDATVPALIMWFFDSRSFVSGSGGKAGPIPTGADFHWVDPDTVPAYMKEQRELIGGKVPPALIFVHIPVQKAQALAALPSPGSHDDEPNPPAQGFLGNKYTELDLPFWKEIVALSAPAGNVLAVTSGHDHGESWCARSKDLSASIPICFNGHSGYGGYATTHTAVRNGRVFALTLNDLSAKTPMVKTWNSYEDGRQAEEIMLGPDYMKEYN